MELKLDQLLRGKATKIKDKEYFPTEGYITPFLERCDKIPGMTYKCHAELPKQITVTTADDLTNIEDITYNRVWIEAVFPKTYTIDNHDRVIGMVYGLDTRVPICKFYVGGENCACTNMCIFNPSDLQVQAIEPKKAVNFKSLEYMIEATNTIHVFLDKLHNTPFDCSTENIEQSLGMWIDNSIDMCWNNGISKASISASTVISAYKLLFKSTKSPYYVDINKGVNTDMFNVYNAFTDIISNHDKDIMTKADKCLLIKSILGLVE